MTASLARLSRIEIASRPASWLYCWRSLMCASDAETPPSEAVQADLFFAGNVPSASYHRIKKCTEANIGMQEVIVAQYSSVRRRWPQPMGLKCPRNSAHCSESPAGLVNLLGKPMPMDMDSHSFRSSGTSCQRQPHCEIVSSWKK